MSDGFIREEDIAKVREANDLVAVVGDYSPVKKKGHDFWCCCPLHHEKTPSFKIDPSTQLWHCFGCGEGGDLFKFIMRIDDLTFPEAVRKLAERAHIEITETQGGQGVSSSVKNRLKEVCRETAAFYHLQLMRSKSSDAARARSYLSGRSFGGEVPKRWNLGFAPGRGALVRYLGTKSFTADEMITANVAMRGRDGRLRDRFFNRVMFPIADAQGECIAFGGRVIGQGEPKYLNSQETPIFHKSQVLYGLDKAKAVMASTGIAVVVEGYTDVIALQEGGIGNAVATLGTALTQSHIRLLSRHARHRIVYLFDGDAAGQRAADRALGFIDDSMTPEAGRSKIELCAVVLPDNLDPAEFVQAKGAEALQKLIAQAEPLLKFGIERRLSAHDLSTPEGRSLALEEALAVLAPIKDSLLAKDYAIQIAGRVRAREQDVLDRLSALKPPRTYGEDAAREESGSQTASISTRSSEAQGETPARSMLSQTERNRLQFEREFLSMVAQNPHLALDHAETLAATLWHHPSHEVLAQSLLGTLAADSAAPATRIITEAEAALPGASSLLTSTVGYGEADPARIAHYLAEELAIGDMDDTVAAMKSRLSDGSVADTDEYEMLFSSVVALQKELSQRRLKHKPLS